MPAGSEGTTLTLRPAPGYLRMRIARWALAQVAAAAGLLFAFGWQLAPPLARLTERIHVGPFSLTGFLEGPVARAFEAWGVALFLLQLAVSFLALRLDNVARWYLLSDRSLRIREGLLTVRERTMTFANVQNVTVRQGPLQRAFGIADLEVRSAGGGDGGADDDNGNENRLHVGTFRGVDNAAAIRDLVLAHLRRLRSAGTGDPDDDARVPVADGGGGTALADALERLAGEVRSLHRVIAQRR